MAVVLPAPPEQAYNAAFVDGAIHRVERDEAACKIL